MQSVISAKRRKLKNILRSKFTQFFVILLIITYTALIFTNIAVEDLEEDKNKSDQVQEYLLNVEICILAIFLIEILLNSYSSGFVHYFTDKWLLLDFTIIIVSIILVVIDLSTDSSSQFSSIASIVRGIFRFLRIFLLIRKVYIKIYNFQININNKQIKKIQSFKKQKFLVQQKHQQKEYQKFQLSLKIILTLLILFRIFNGLWILLPLINYMIHYYFLIKIKKVRYLIYNNKIFYKHNKIKAQEWHKKQFYFIIFIIHIQKFLNIKSFLYIYIYILQNYFYLIYNFKVDELNFDCFKLELITKGDETSLLLIYLFNKYNLIEELRIDQNVFKQFTKGIQNGYKNNPYHNKLHSFDVLQTIHFFMKKCKFTYIAKLSKLEQAAMYIAAAAHDYDHQGYNNVFLINTSNILALKYNDISVLENHHVSSLFQLVLNEKVNIFQHFKNEEFKQFREIVIGMILATDMSKHFSDIAMLKSRLSQDFEIDGKDKKICMESLLHSADVSNPIKEWKICFQWTNKVMTEFWNQGDEERLLGLPIAYLCDRYTTNVSKSQTGFIDFIVKPLFEVVAIALPDLQQYLKNFETNKQNWIELQPKYEEEL
ncbi:hypothetical protein IMG5_112180, partial [Ichthyophthirius multifiliis]